MDRPPRALACLIMLTPLAGCGALGEVPASFATAMASAAATTGEAELEIDAAGAVIAVRVPVAEDLLPPRARAAALAIQPGGDSVAIAREDGPFGSGFRWATRYGAEQRTVLVSAEGTVLHKTWEVPAPETPRPVLAAAARSCPGDLVRIEASQDTGPGARWVVTARGPDGVLRQWRGDHRGRGRAWVVSSASVTSELR
jgi:hypothetical protein